MEGILIALTLFRTTNSGFAWITILGKNGVINSLLVFGTLHKANVVYELLDYYRFGLFILTNIDYDHL